MSIACSNRDTAQLGTGTFDVLIIGGGIIGAGVARDAALRGIRVALVDQGDFGSGTSSRSSKLVHGGLRYLEHFEFRLVYEACRERQILLRIAPHLVQPIPILFPCYRGIGRPLWKVRCGLAFYDMLAGDRSIRRHRMLPAEQIRNMEPNLSLNDLDGAGLYYDCRMNDARLCLENILAADQAGACVANYVRLEGLAKCNGRIAGADVRDLETGMEIHVRAKVVVNATGPWADRLRLLDDPAADPLVRKTRGIHLVTRRILNSAGLAWTARTDGRLLFLMPFDDQHSLIGTTDTDSLEDPAGPAVEDADVGYLLSEVNDVLSGTGISRKDVKGAFAGIRTLISRRGDPASLSREYNIEESQAGLISVIGGKYTTYRAMAARTVDRVMRRLGLPNGRCQTTDALPSAPDGGFEERVMGRYGLRVADVMACADGDPGLREEMFEKSGVVWAEVLYALRFEMARHPMDFLRRRTTLCLTRRPDSNVTERIARYYQSHLGWDPGKTERETAQALQEWARYYLEESA